MSPEDSSSRCLQRTHFNIISPHTLRLVTGLFNPPTFLSHFSSPLCYLQCQTIYRLIKHLNMPGS